MKITENSKIILSSGINEEQYKEISILESICHKHDNICFKFELDYKMQKNIQLNSSEVNEFLYYNHNKLIGYLGICSFDDNELELNGMVHPDFRNQDIFTHLYQLAYDEFNKRSAKILLFICDKKSTLGLKFIEKLKSSYHHAEYDMYLDATVFSRDIEYHLDMHEIDKEKHLFVGKKDNKIVGEVRLENRPELGGIYGLEVLPEFRRKGYGREILTWSIEKLISLGSEKIFLQVDTTNGNALNLYKSCGFVEEVVMLYYTVHKK